MKEKTIQPNDTTNFEKKKKKRKRDSQEVEELENKTNEQKNEETTQKVKKTEKKKEQENNVEDQKKKTKKTKKNKKNKEKTEDNNNNNNNNSKNENDIVESEEPEKKKMKKKKSKKQKKEENKQEQDQKVDDSTTNNNNDNEDVDSSSSSSPQIHFHSKSLYKESEATKKLTQDQVEEFHTKNNITVSENGKMFKPILSFKDSQFSPDMLVSCKDFSSPTPIQSQSWPIILSGRDLIGIAATGSGKTIAFVLPSLVHIKHEATKNNNNNNKKNNSNNKSGPTVLVLSPTRELAMQTDQVYSSAGKAANIHSICVYGGVPKDEQRRAIRSGAQVVVGTPGRIIDLIEEGSLPTERVTYLVLDEADRMLDLGFKDAIHSIISKTTPTGIRQTLMFSATWPEEIQELAHKYLSHPIKVTIGSQDLAACHSVTQIVEVMESRDKDRRLDELLKKYHSNRKNKVLVFVLYKKEAVRVGNMLQYKGWKCTAIHGDLTQQQRTLAINQFKDGQRPLLIATDVVARGLDIPDVEYVINYTFPLTIEDYVHRIGRTGRAGKEGLAHTLFTSFDKTRAGELVNILKEANQEVPAELEKFGPSPNRKKEHALYGHHFKGTETNGGGAPPKSSHIIFD